MNDKDFRIVFGAMPDDTLITVEQAAQLMPCSAAAMYKRIERQRVDLNAATVPPHTRLGGNEIRFKAGSIREWVRQLAERGSGVDYDTEEAARAARIVSSGSKVRGGRPRKLAVDLNGHLVTPASAP